MTTSTSAARPADGSPIPDLMEPVEELSEADEECETRDVCEKCTEERCEREDGYCREHYLQNYPEVAK